MEKGYKCSNRYILKKQKTLLKKKHIYALRGDSGWGEGGIGLEPPLDVGEFSVGLPPFSWSSKMFES